MTGKPNQAARTVTLTPPEDWNTLALRVRQVHSEHPDTWDAIFEIISDASWELTSYGEAYERFVVARAWSKLLARLGGKCKTTPTIDVRHFLNDGPFAVCGCGFKEDVALIGMMCMRCGQRADGPFVIRDGEQIKCKVTK